MCMDKSNIIWRLGFNEMEKQIFSEYEYGKMKPVIRILKVFIKLKYIINF